MVYQVIAMQKLTSTNQNPRRRMAVRSTAILLLGFYVLIFYKVVNKMTRVAQSAALVILFSKVGLLNFVTFEILCLNIFGVS
jgi:hypothetical protein